MEDSDDIRSSVQHGIDVLAQQRGADTQPDENAAERVRQATDLIRDQATTTSDLIRLYDTWAEKYDQVHLLIFSCGCVFLDLQPLLERPC